MSENEERYEDMIQRLILDVETTKIDLKDNMLRHMVDIPYLMIGVIILFIVIPVMTLMRNVDYVSVLISSVALILSASRARAH